MAASFQAKGTSSINPNPSKEQGTDPLSTKKEKAPPQTYDEYLSKITNLVTEMKENTAIQNLTQDSGRHGETNFLAQIFGDIQNEIEKVKKRENQA